MQCERSSWKGLIRSGLGSSTATVTNMDLGETNCVQLLTTARTHRPHSPPPALTTARTHHRPHSPPPLLRTLDIPHPRPRSSHDNRVQWLASMAPLSWTMHPLSVNQSLVCSNDLCNVHSIFMRYIHHPPHSKSPHHHQLVLTDYCFQRRHSPIQLNIVKNPCHLVLVPLIPPSESHPYHSRM